MTQRTIIVGDVHGCFDELLGLMDKCQATSSDRIISVGDLVDRGPKVREVVEFFMKHESVLGNHEERQLKYFVEWQKAGSPTDPALLKKALRWKADYHHDSFVSLGPQHFEWFKTLPKFLRLPYTDPAGNEVVVVHAGCVPEVPLEQQDDFILMHVSDIMTPPIGGFDEFGRVRHGYWRGKEQSWWTSKAPPGACFWASIYDGSNGHVVFGHSGFADPARFPHATGIDTGCCFGRSLTALILPEWRTVSVPAQAPYKGSTRIKVFEVYPGIEVFS